MLASFSKLAQQMSEENRAPNLGDVLAEHGGSQYKLPVTVNESLLKTSFPDMGLNEVKTLPVYKDEISGFRSSFMNIPIEYLHHDDHINPRTIGSNLRKLVVEFHRKLPQLHIVSNQQKWDTLGAERSGAGWRSGELPEGPVVASSPFGGLSLHLLPAL